MAYYLTQTSTGCGMGNFFLGGTILKDGGLGVLSIWLWNNRGQNNKRSKDLGALLDSCS